MGVSRRTLFAARKSDETVTVKTWAKLAAAERRADLQDGLLAMRKRQAELAANDEDFGKQTLATVPFVEAAAATQEAERARIEEMDEDIPEGAGQRFDRLEKLLGEMLARFDALEAAVRGTRGKSNRKGET